MTHFRYLVELFSYIFHEGKDFHLPAPMAREER